MEHQLHFANGRWSSNSKALFQDEAYVDARSVNPEANGILVRDPTLKDLLKEALWQFAQSYSAKDRRKVLKKKVS